MADRTTPTLTPQEVTDELARMAKTTQIMQNMLDQIGPALQVLTASAKDTKISQYLDASRCLHSGVPVSDGAIFEQHMRKRDGIIRNLLNYADSWADAKLQERREQ